MTKRNLYLNNTPLEEAKKIYESKIIDILNNIRTEEISVTESLGRINAKPVYAKYSSPLYNCAAMDGIMIESDYTKSASDSCPLILDSQRYEEVDTGDPIKNPYDCVIMAEDIIEKDGVVQIIAPAHPWQHVRPIGEDIVATELIMSINHKIRAIDIGVLLSAGITKLSVYAKPKIGIIPTGTEMIEPDQTPKEGDIIESNSRVFEALVTELGGTSVRIPPVKDDYDSIKQKIVELCKECDMIIINAGSSAGREDFTVSILKELGEVFIHGVAIKPGKPAILARIGNIPVIGIPGYPVSAYIVFEEFAAPLIKRLSHIDVRDSEIIEAVATRRMVSSLKHREYIRVNAGLVDGKYVATPLSRGAGSAMSLVKSDGFCIVEQNSEGVDMNEPVKVRLVKQKEALDNTIVSIGSHDIIMDVMSNLFNKMKKETRLTSAHTGSFGGITSLRKSECHIAPIHILDQNGDYNIGEIQKLKNREYALIKGVRRIQGLIVPKGNPKNIESLMDLTRLTYINRQRGAGTRILLDYKLNSLDIDKSLIKGYEREAVTHMAVAAAIKSGSCDTGLGVFSAAKALDLDFVPIGEEEYDFAIAKDYLKLPIIEEFLEIIQSDEFKNELELLGGYSYPDLGKIIFFD